MARTVRDARLQTRTSRLTLSHRSKPYYRSIDPGLHLGYRRAASGGGKWVLRFYIGDERYVTETFATADDYGDADGVHTLTFSQAQFKARERAAELQRVSDGRAIAGPYTVKDAVEDYLTWMANHRKGAVDARQRAEALIIPDLGALDVSRLSPAIIRRWLNALAERPPRKRTRPGEVQRYHEVEDDPDWQRRRKATANRLLTILKAALNHAWHEGIIQSDEAWRRVKPFPNVDAARLRYLTIDEATRLINASSAEFRNLVRAALATGARYGELTRLVVEDFDGDAGTVRIRQSKSGKSRHVVLTDEGRQLFERLTLGKRGADLILTRPDGFAWGISHQQRPIQEACRRAGIDPPINFHQLRHTYASLSVMAGMPLLVLARNLGHTDTRMVEKHYGHLAESYVAEMIRATAPTFGTKPTNVKKSRVRK